MNLLHIVILSLVEGLTEFLPISSTGHMVLVSSALKIPNTEFVKTFEISIQLGAILAIVCLYSNKLFKSVDLYKKLFIAFVPTGVVGFLFYKIIKDYLFNPLIVSMALIIGGFTLIWADRMSKTNNRAEIDFENIDYRKAIIIGFSQTLAIIPGVSRAASTILGGIFCGLSRKQAAEFSFLLAIPTMLIATGYDLLKSSAIIGLDEVVAILIGTGVSFVTAWFTVRLFIKHIDRRSLTVFGWYRIVLGVGFLLLNI
jgi:undecaprenyl-diphosphatase